MARWWPTTAARARALRVSTGERCRGGRFNNDGDVSYGKRETFHSGFAFCVGCRVGVFLGC